MKLTFGKYKGYKLSQVPEDYLEWGINNLDSPKWQKAFRDELNSRPEPTEDQLIDKYWNQLEDWEQSPSSYQSCVDTAKAEIKKRELDKQADACLEKYSQLLKTDTGTLHQKYFDVVQYPENLIRTNFSSQEKFEIFSEFYTEYSRLFDQQYELGI